MDFNLVQQLREASPFQPISDGESADRKTEKYKAAAEHLARIDWKGLEAKLTEVLKTPITLKVWIEEGRDPYIRWECNEDLLPLSGVFQAAMAKVKVAVFNSTNISSLQQGQNFYWCTAKLQYEHIGGGSNGAGLFSAWYEFPKQAWTFRMDGE